MGTLLNATMTAYSIGIAVLENRIMHSHGGDEWN